MASNNHITLVSDAGAGDSRSAEQLPVSSGSAKPVRQGETHSGSGDLVGAGNTVNLLAQAIQHEIIPRLMLVHRTPTECSDPCPSIGLGIGPADVNRFVDVLLTGTEADSVSWIENTRLQGDSIETIYLDLLAPAARHLGDMWNEDLCDFTDVTIALGQLHKLVHMLQDGFKRHQGPPLNGLRVLLMPSPGEQHTFGLTMVTDFFQRAGWEVAGGPYAASDDPATLVKKNRYDAVGFSLGASVGLNRLKECIAAVRAAAAPWQVCIIVGGPLFMAHPEQAADVGADLVVHDAKLAPELVQRHIAGASPTHQSCAFNH
jgi:MerR family transcriptional regulator, light-induced transcriptional regulator